MSIIDRFRLDGKKAYVTGGAQGIGKSMAIGLLEAGADVAVIDVNFEAAKKTAEEIALPGRDVFAIGADVSNESEVADMMSRIIGRFGTIDIAVNNAGICINKNTDVMTLAEWQKVININLTGVYLTAKAAGMIMIQKRSGSIINTGSMAGQIIPEPQYHCAYSSSKAGVLHLTRSLAAEWAPYNVRVNSVSPGYTETEIVKLVKQQSWLDRTPMHRLGQPEDLQGAVIYLASEASAYTTGIDILVDGGFCCW
jgi:NAD(P)-dependent dehydrogenase (short-subunit alcohol dehydrogenase family)